MQVTPSADGTLLVRDPTADLRYDMGNPRLFVTLDGASNITHFSLPEGVSVLRTWQSAVRVDETPVRWTEAEAIGRSWILHGTAPEAEIAVRTVCEAAHPALIQVWRVSNRGPVERVFSLDLDVTFDLHPPPVRVGMSAANARLYRFVRDSLLTRRTLGPWRWEVFNWLAGAQERLLARLGHKLLDIEMLSDGVRVRGNVTATLRAGETPAALTTTPYGAQMSFRIIVGPGRSHLLPIVLSAGGSLDPAGYRAALQEADDYATWLTSAFEHDDPVLRSLYVACLNTAVAMYKEMPSGFAGLWAGAGYRYPPRVYYRDSYWTALTLLPYRPDWVRNNLLALASGVHPDGTCPSGVIDRSILPFEDQDMPGAMDWLPDHLDSPAFFVLLLYEYLAWTGDMSLMNEQLEDGRTIWGCAQACLNRLTANPAKERAPNDWADNVLRSEWVTYDLALLVGALHAAAEIARHIGESNAAATYAQDAYQISQLLQIHNWDDTLGHYLDYRRTGDYSGHPLIENHLALDTLLALRFQATPPERAERVLTAMRDRLQTRHNMFQPYDDWGVMCCWPPYRHRADVFGRSSRAYNFHNGAEWPYLSAIYAQILLERGDPDWRYVLTRWWKIQLEQGWLTPVEYHTPAHPVGEFFQGWSSLSVSAMLAGGLNLRPALNGKSAPRVPPWGVCTFRYLNIRGQERTVTVAEGGVKIE